MNPRLVLIGPPGVGKSTVAQAVARAWGVECCDTDRMVEACAAMSVSDIFLSLGEEHFRDLEAQMVAKALADCSGVVSLGGGAPMNPQTATLLAGQCVGFLDVSLAKAMQRNGLGAGRPLLAGNPRAQWKRLMDTRRPVYQALASFTVDTTDLSIDEVVQEVCKNVQMQSS